MNEYTKTIINGLTTALTSKINTYCEKLGNTLTGKINKAQSTANSAKAAAQAAQTAADEAKVTAEEVQSTAQAATDEAMANINRLQTQNFTVYGTDHGLLPINWGFISGNPESRSGINYDGLTYKRMWDGRVDFVQNKVDVIATFQDGTMLDVGIEGEGCWGIGVWGSKLDSPEEKSKPLAAIMVTRPGTCKLGNRLNSPVGDDNPEYAYPYKYVTFTANLAGLYALYDESDKVENVTIYGEYAPRMPKKIYMANSAHSKVFTITVDDSGTLSATEVT